MDMEKPKSKLYFIKKPTEVSLRHGRKPVIGRIKKVNPKTISKGRQQFLEKVYKRRQVPEGKKKGFIKEAVDADAQRRLTAIAQQERERRESKRITPVDDTETLKRVKQKSIVGKQEQARQEVIDNARRETEKVAEQLKTTALLELPPALERARVAIQQLEPIQQAQLVALHNVAPQVSQNIVDEWARRFPNAPQAPPLPPAPARAVPAQPQALTQAQQLISAQIPNGGNNLRDLRLLFNVPRAQYRTVIARLDRISSAELENLLQGTRGNLDGGFATQIEDIIRQKQGVGAGLKFKKGKKIKGGALADPVPAPAPVLNQQDYDMIRQQYGYYPKSYYVHFLNQGENQGNISFYNQQAIQQQINANQHLIEPEPHGAGFFSDAFNKVKDLAKSGVNKLVDIVKDDPIGSAKKAFELGKQGRDEYKKHFGKKEKGGKMFIPKKHIKAIHRHLKKVHGGGFADWFIKGLTAPFALASKINPVFGFGVPQLSKALGLPSL